MEEHLRLEALDGVPGLHDDGEDDEDGISRSGFVGGALLAGGGLILGGAAAGGLAGAASSAPSRSADVRILKFFLTIEQLQAAFFAAALDGVRLRGELRELAEVVGKHDRRHAAWLKRKLGRRAGAEAKHEFGDALASAKKFAAAALELKENAVAGYVGQAPSLTRYVSDVGRMTSVEARHVAWIRDYLGRNPAPRAADPGKSPQQVVQALKKRGLVA